MQAGEPAARNGRSDTLTANAEISVDGRSIQLNLLVPAGKVPIEAILPILHQFSEQVVAGVEEKASESGTAIACKKGCGACCRQPVPVTHAEARQLAALVEGMPAREKAAVKERFKTAMKKARNAGVSETPVGLKRMDEETKRTFAVAYFTQGIACPFLVDESCSIHVDRPLICREYLVSSSPGHCGNLDGSKIKLLRFPAPITQTFGNMESGKTGEKDSHILLIAALDWVSENPGKGTERPGPEWVQEFFQKLSRSKIPDPSPYL